MTAEPSKRLDRLSSVEAAPLDPGSLVGAFFHGTAEPGWQGCVVAEPTPGVYLVELFDWIVGASSTQRLVWIEQMSDWQFYDDAEWMANAYREGVNPAWRERDKPIENSVGIDVETSSDRKPSQSPS